MDTVLWPSAQLAAVTPGIRLSSGLARHDLSPDGSSLSGALRVCQSKHQILHDVIKDLYSLETRDKPHVRTVAIATNRKRLDQLGQDMPPTMTAISRPSPPPHIFGLL